MDDKENLNEDQESRRAFVKKAVYVPPAILTLQATPAYAKYGSEKPSGDKDSGGQKDKGDENGNKEKKDKGDEKGK